MSQLRYGSAAVTDRIAAAYREFDALNMNDPVSEDTERGPLPRDFLYGVRMSEMLKKLDPKPSDALSLAVRAQHLCRFELPRDSFPVGRAGYHRWRIRLRRHHSEKAAAVLRSLDFDNDTVLRVCSLIEKRDLSTDPEAQMLEDAACLVFVFHQLDAFAARHPDDKMMTILTKTMMKMSDEGLAMAASLPVSNASRTLLTRALRVFRGSPSAEPSAPKGDS